MHHRATHLRADGLSPVHVATAAGASGGAGAASSAPASATASGGSSGGSNGHGQYRYTPLATSTNSSSSDDEGLALHHHRSSTTWERLHWGTWDGGDFTSQRSINHQSSTNSTRHPTLPPTVSTALIKHRWPLLGALGLLVLALLLLGPKLQQAMSELPPWKHTFRSLTGVCKEVG